MEGDVMLRCSHVEVNGHVGPVGEVPMFHAPFHTHFLGTESSSGGRVDSSGSGSSGTGTCTGTDTGARVRVHRFSKHELDGK